MHEPQEEYAGPATLDVDGTPTLVEVHLRGGFQPIDGHFHWQGRVLTPLEVRSGATVVLTTEHGSAAGRLSDLDPWGRYRIAGVGQPPF
jgi:hypothetical protein